MIEQGNFDALCLVTSRLLELEGSHRRQLVEGLCSSLDSLITWIKRLLSAPPDSIDHATLMQHRSAFKVCIFLLYWATALFVNEEREAGSAAAALPGAAAAKGRGKRKTQQTELDGWDLRSLFPKVMRTVAHAMSVNLAALFRPNRPEDAFLVKVIHMVRDAMPVIAS